MECQSHFILSDFCLPMKTEIKKLFIKTKFLIFNIEDKEFLNNILDIN